MNFLITGGTGFIGSALCAQLLMGGHNIVVKSRRPERVREPVRGIGELAQLDSDECFDVVINFAGEAIASKRWSEKQKTRIVQSRLETTQELIDYFNRVKNKPSLFISGSAIGYYGICSTNEIVDEDSLGDDSFSSQLCRQWEALAVEAETVGIRTCLLRTGIVLGRGGGALQKMLLPFKWGLGGRIGSGAQWMPWIHIEDLIAIIIYCIHHPALKGPINGTAPYPVTNAEFATALGNALNRPLLLHLPAGFIKLLMGTMGEELLLSGRKVLPAKIQQAGFTFKFANIEPALLDIV